MRAQEEDKKEDRKQEKEVSSVKIKHLQQTNRNHYQNNREGICNDVKCGFYFVSVCMREHIFVYPTNSESQERRKPRREK